MAVTAERCLSGRKSTPGKCVYVHSVPGVRIPLSPPLRYNRTWAGSRERPAHIRCLDRGFWIHCRIRPPASRTPARILSSHVSSHVDRRQFPCHLPPGVAFPKQSIRESVPSCVYCDITGWIRFAPDRHCHRQEQTGRQVFFRYFQNDPRAILLFRIFVMLCYVIL